MRKSLKALAVVAALATTGTARAEAQFAWSGCGGSGNPGFNTCASINISVGSGVLTMTVQNWGTWNPASNSACSPFCGSSVFTALGLQNIGGSLTGLNSAVCTNDPVCGWAFDSNLNGLPGFSGGGATAPPPSNGLNPPATSGAGNFTQVILTFSTSGTINLANATVFGLHGQVGPNNCSTKLFVTNNGGTYTTNSTTATNSCFGTPNTPVPEPMSMVLVATGLVAMGGAGLLRRRRKV